MKKTIPANLQKILTSILIKVVFIFKIISIYLRIPVLAQIRRQEEA